jgi:sodium/calcium exchanger protein
MVDMAEVFGSGRVMMLVGAVLLYVASRAGVEALAGRAASPGKRAVGHWIPIAAAAIVAISVRRSDIALSIIFATSVGCLSLVLGSIFIASPHLDAPQAYRRLWPFALPAGLLTLLTGFAGHLSWWHAGFLLAEGIAVMLAWRELSTDGVIDAQLEPRAGEWVAWMNFGLCILLSILGGIAGVFGAEHLSETLHSISDMATVVAVLGPLLILPILAGAGQLAQTNRAGAAVTTAVGVVLLNLCVLLPVVVVLNYVLQGSGGVMARIAAMEEAGPMPFSWISWRVDNVVLVCLSFALIPASMGRWKLGKAEGITLIGLYAVYVVMEVAGSLRM